MNDRPVYARNVVINVSIFVCFTKLASSTTSNVSILEFVEVIKVSIFVCFIKQLSVFRVGLSETCVTELDSCLASRMIRLRHPVQFVHTFAFYAFF